MSATFEALKTTLEKNKKLSVVEIDAAIAAHGALSDEHRVWLESERFRLERETHETVTMEQYLAALKQLDTLEEGSPEFVKMEALVARYESGT